MRTVRLIVKRSLLGLFGLMVYAALGFSSNVRVRCEWPGTRSGLRAGEPLRLWCKKFSHHMATTSSGRGAEAQVVKPQSYKEHVSKRGIGNSPVDRPQTLGSSDRG